MSINHQMTSPWFPLNFSFPVRLPLPRCPPIYFPFPLPVPLHILTVPPSTSFSLKPSSSQITASNPDSKILSILTNSTGLSTNVAMLSPVTQPQTYLLSPQSYSMSSDASFRLFLARFQICPHVQAFAQALPFTEMPFHPSQPSGIPFALSVCSTTLGPACLSISPAPAVYG
uniref:Uncharacterized protein n=1 Tax=Molossus molossus TaxID=27622 RepID=A0A7J8JV81_MOLMO|nr:hypothetical protein HJG59_007854 [Molossus molossus]